MTRKKKIEEKQLAEVEFTECCAGDGQSNEIIDLLKNMINQNSQIIQLLTKLKERFI